MKALFDLQKPSIAISYLQLLVEIASERGIPPSKLLAGVPISAKLLDEPGARMSPVQWALAVSNAMRLFDEPGLGYECGLRMRPTANGFLGYATMSCGSMHEALEIAARYFESRQRDFSLRIGQDGDHALVEVREKHLIPALRSFFYEHILVGVARGAAAILGKEIDQLDGLELWFDWPEPAYHVRYRRRLPRVRFSRRANLLRFPARLLDLKPVLADPQASTQAVAMCERELAQLGGRGDSVSLRVCAELEPSPKGDGYPGFGAVARRLHMSERTLARKLRDEGTSFKTLREEACMRDACALLENSPLRLQDVASRLGYTNPANFTRAFQRWSGEAPSAWRARHQT